MRPGRPWSGLLLLLGGAALVGARSAAASGAMTVTFDQTADCASVTSWLVEENGTTIATLANAAPLVCGPGITVSVPATGVGPQSFTVTAVAGGGAAAIDSAPSDAVSGTVPLAAPVLDTVKH